MVTVPRVQRSEWSRLWLIKWTAGPAHPPSYEGLGRAGAADWSRGDMTPIYVPDPGQYNEFLVAGKIQGDRSLPTLATTFRYLHDQAGMINRFIRQGCDLDLQIHMGLCQDPQDFNFGWEKILVLIKATATNWSTTDLGALEPSERAMVNEEIPWTGEDIFEILRIVFTEQAETEAVQEIIDIRICDEVSCGECGLPSDGCDIVFALTLSAGGSPGLPAELLYTEDGGENWSDTGISTLAANEDPNELACVGRNVVVISEDAEEIHYAPIVDILNGTETWTEIGTGFVAGFGPLAIYSTGPRHTWIVGEVGYVYFTEDPTTGVTIQDAGITTIQDLLDVHAYDNENIVAVGVNNAVIVSRNGTTWAAVTGPNAGVTLNTVFMRGPDEWFIGDAGGQLWYTLDGGVSWVEKAFPGSPDAGVVHHIDFSNSTVGYMAHSTALNAGRILRTIDGGYSWYIAPESNVEIPENDKINRVAACLQNPNVVYGGGLAGDGTDGIIVKGS